MQRTATRFSLPCFLVLLAHVEVVTAVDFRIESRVFVEKEDEPVSTSTTLFKAGLTYDFLENPRETTFLDPRRGRIVLLDATHGLKTEIRIAQIVEFATQLKLRAAGSDDALLQFLAEPKFQETWDSEGNELVLSSKLMTYRVTPIKAPSAEVAKQYQFFSNWYAQLNAMTHASGLPPFARAKLDEALGQRGLIPKNVELTVSMNSKLGRRKVTLRSEHEIAWRLLQADERRIDETHTAMGSYRSVTFDEFLQRTAVKQTARK